MNRHKHRWVLIDRERLEVFFVGQMKDEVVEEFFSKFALCLQEPDNVRVHVGWLYVKNYDGSHCYREPHQNEKRNTMPKELSYSSLGTHVPPLPKDTPKKSGGFRLEGVTVCVNYSDFLEHSLPENLQYLDHLTVVTSYDDKRTIDLCNRYGVQAVQTDVFYEHGDKFNKGRGINVGLAHCRNDGFLVHFDADTVFPHRFRYTLQTMALQEDVIYGVDRLNVKNFSNWKNSKDYLTPQFENGCHVVAHKDFSMSSRLLHGDYGYLPIGYFQLWHSSNKRNYPGNCGSSEHSDVLFALQWPRVKRILIPNLFVYHLESEPAPMGYNWEGRKSKKFGPEGNK